MRDDTPHRRDSDDRIDRIEDTLGRIDTRLGTMENSMARLTDAMTSLARMEEKNDRCSGHDRTTAL